MYRYTDGSRQEGDGIPGISSEEQRELTVGCIMGWINGEARDYFSTDS